MEDKRILIDTSIIIEFLRKQNKRKTVLWKLKEREYLIIISSITVFELYAGAKEERHYEDLKRLLKWIEVENFTEEIAKNAGKIYRELKEKNKLIEFRDIFIGATAQNLQLPLITFNKKHFERIKKIKVLDTKEI